MINQHSDEISILELKNRIIQLLKFYVTKWKIILIFVIIGSITGYTISKKDNYKYDANLTFVLEEDRGSNSGGGITGALGIASSLGIDIGSAGGAFSGPNLLEFMKSRFIIEKTLLKPINNFGNNQISIAEYYIQINKLRENWVGTKFEKIKFDINDSRENYSREKDSILNIFYEELTDKNVLTIGQIDKKSTITQVRVRYKNEVFAKYFCETLVNVTSEYYIELKSKKARDNFENLEKQVDSIRNILNNAIENVALNIDNNYNLNPAFNILRTKADKKRVDVQSNSVILTQLLGQLQLARLSLRKETPLIQIIDKPILPLQKKKIEVYFAIKIGILISLFFSLIFLFFIYKIQSPNQFTKH